MTALYDVAAIGNAIVDVIAQCDDAFLEREGLVKGSMALIDPARAATISLNCDFVASAKLGDAVIGRAQITRRTRTIVFVSAQLTVADKPVLTATGIWKIVDQGEPAS